jgi:uncharacterized protein YraI
MKLASGKSKERERRMLKLFAAAIITATIAASGAVAFSTSADARAYCYNTRTGAFQHWGYCRVVCNGRHCRKVGW